MRLLFQIHPYMVCTVECFRLVSMVSASTESVRG